MNNIYLPSLEKQFQYYKSLGDKTLKQINEDECFWSENDQSNSVAIIVKHVWGNMRSRWTAFLTTDGEKPWRNRDTEFADDLETKEDILAKWEEGWTCVFKAIEESKELDPTTTIKIRNVDHTLVEAFTRQVAHYAYHVGQIVYLGKMIKGHEWNNLSIAKDESKAFNEEHDLDY